MIFPKTYKSLTKQEFIGNGYKICPIKYEHRIKILKWRNEQIIHLRQKKLLTKSDQDNYFNNVLRKTFDEMLPNQILFSFYHKDKFVGYGGLVHIDWKKKIAEISFLMNTLLEKNFFVEYWINFLDLIEDVAFNDLKLNKTFLVVFDVRPLLYKVIEKSGYLFSKKMKNRYNFKNEKYNIFHYVKYPEKISFDLATMDDINIFFEWANEKETRENSFNNKEIFYDEHKNWYTSKINNEKNIFLVFKFNDDPFGQVRLEPFDKKNYIVGISLSHKYRSKGLASVILKLATDYFFNKFKGYNLLAEIKSGNDKSIKVFENVGFKFFNYLIKNNHNALVYEKKN